MAIVSLLRLPLTPREHWAFVFEHDQAHRRWTKGLQKQNKAQQTHLLDPMRHQGLPGSKWHLDHQLAHKEMAPPPLTSQVLIDSSLPHERAWWEFANHHEHWRKQSD